VGNKIRNDDEADFIRNESPGIEVLGYLPADMRVQEADRLGVPVYDLAPALKNEAARIAGSLLNPVNN
jgi:CO dehydrogenase nickel-insertion accessory protein CooC1